MKKIIQKIIFGLIFALTSGTSSISAVEPSETPAKKALRKTQGQDTEVIEFQYGQKKDAQDYYNQSSKSKANQMDFKKKTDLHILLGRNQKLAGVSKKTYTTTDPNILLESNIKAAYKSALDHITFRNNMAKSHNFSDFLKNDLDKAMKSLLRVKEAYSPQDLQRKMFEINNILQEVDKKAQEKIFFQKEMGEIDSQIIWEVDNLMNHDSMYRKP